MKPLQIRCTLKFLLINLLVVFSCSNMEKYTYYNGLSKYMIDNFNIDFNNVDDTIYYFLPINRCNTCEGTNLNLKALNSLDSKKNVVVIIIGLEENSTYTQKIQNLPFETVLFDNKGLVNKYQTGILKPLLIHVNKGNCIFYLEINDPKIGKAKQYLLENAISL